VADDQAPASPLNHRNFLKVVGAGIIIFFSESAWAARIGTAAEKPSPISNHFNGTYYFNPGSPSSTGEGMTQPLGSFDLEVVGHPLRLEGTVR